MADLTIQKAGVSGVAPAFAAATVGGDTFSNDGSCQLHVKNGSAGSINVTVTSPNKCNQGFTHDVVQAVAAGETRVFGPFQPGRFNGANGKVTVTCSAVASVTLAVVDTTA